MYLHMHDGEPVVYEDKCPVFLTCPACGIAHTCGNGCNYVETQEEIDSLKGHNSD